ncbi:MAG: Cell division protein FtsA [Cryomorphaceae bacterium]|nr:MAG: Cell division protein FtsA [Cryomorphaceae bacterium]
MTGIVITGGGAQIRNLKQLVAFVTGKETRIGFPNEHLGSESKDTVVSPMYATGVGLVMKGFEHEEYTKVPSKRATNINHDENKEIDEALLDGDRNVEPTLMDKFTGWFTEENID